MSLILISSVVLHVVSFFQFYFGMLYWPTMVEMLYYPIPKQSYSSLQCFGERVTMVGQLISTFFMGCLLNSSIIELSSMVKLSYSILVGPFVFSIVLFSRHHALNIALQPWLSQGIACFEYLSSCSLCIGHCCSPFCVTNIACLIGWHEQMP